MLRSLIFLTIVLALSAPASPQAASSASSVKPGAEIWYTEQFLMHSKAVGRDFLIQVARPPKLADGTKAPAIYVLDGNATFGMAANIMQGSVSGGGMAPAFIVGVGYPAQTRENWQDLRGRDLTFAHVPPTDPSDHDVTGEASKFQRFVSEELRPRIEAHYPVNGAMPAGHSYGGLFALHVLLNTPAAFDGYLIGSPSIWAEPALLDKAATFRAPVKIPVFMSVGANEVGQSDAIYHMVTNVQKLAARLADHASNINLKTWVVPDENHNTVRPAFLARAMLFVMSPPDDAPGH